MPETFDIKQYETLETELHKQLGKNCFAYIAPASIDQRFKKDIDKLEKNILKKLKKAENRAKISQFISILQYNDIVPVPIILEEQMGMIEPTVYNFLFAQHVLQYTRFLKALPELASYSLQFFIPPLSVENAVKFKSEELVAPYTFSINMPFVLKTNSEGFFDLNQTIEYEKKYNLIKAKLAGIATLENTIHLVNQKIENFSKWAFFVVYHSNEIRAISSELTQIVYDFFMIFAYTQLKQGFSIAEANKNAAAYIIEMAKRKQLERMTVYRAENEMSLGDYIVSMLKRMKTAYPYIKDETLKDFYTHIFISITQIILKNLYVFGTFYNIEIREATLEESAITNSEYTITVSAILDNGIAVKEVKEYYAVKLAEDSFRALVQTATKDLQMFNYYI